MLSGRPTLRTVDGERRLEEGELVCFRTGREGAHRIDNRTDEPVRVLIVSTMIGPDVVEHVDSQKVYARSFAPGADPPADAVEVMVKREDSRTSSRARASRRGQICASSSSTTARCSAT